MSQKTSVSFCFCHTPGSHGSPFIFLSPDSSQCVYLLYSVWALQLLPRPQSQPGESQDSFIHPRTRITGPRPQQVFYFTRVLGNLVCWWVWMSVSSLNRDIHESSSSLIQATTPFLFGSFRFLCFISMPLSRMLPSGSTDGGTAVSARLRSSGWKQRSACWRPKSKRSGSSWGWRGGAYSGAPPTEREAPPPFSCNLGPPNTTALSRLLRESGWDKTLNTGHRHVREIWGNYHDMTESLSVQAPEASMSPGGPRHDGCISGWEPPWWDPTAPWDKVYQILEDEEHWNSQLERWHQGKQGPQGHYSRSSSSSNNRGLTGTSFPTRSQKCIH